MDLPVHYSLSKIQQKPTGIRAAHAESVGCSCVSFSYAVKLLKCGKQQSQSDLLSFSSTASFLSCESR